MDAPAAQHWFLPKHEDGSIFGPLGFEQLARLGLVRTNGAA
jgi:hypothetical protein